MYIRNDISEKFSKLLNLGSATVCEAQNSKGVLDSGIKPIDNAMRMIGPAITLDMQPGDNLMIHFALLKAKPGDVLVIDAKGFLEAGLWGDVLTEQAMTIGLAGVIVNGAVRDTREIIATGFPVFTRGVCIKGTSKILPGSFNTPICIGNIIIDPGDIILADCDGLVIIDKNDVNDVLTKATIREVKENEFKKRIRHGATTVELIGLNKELETYNLK